MFHLVWCSNSSTACRGSLPIEAPEDLGEINICKVCVGLLHFFLKAGLTQLIPFHSWGRRFDEFTFSEILSFKILLKFSRASLRIGLAESIAGVPFCLN